MTHDSPPPEDGAASVDPFATRPSTAERVPFEKDVSCRDGDPLALASGDRFDDFEIVSVLGRGSFGVVYLARQRSLERRVALKIAPVRGQEGRAMARLDHPNIIAVYAQQIRDGLRILCIQYVPSVPLDNLLRRLAERGANWNGAELLDAIDEESTDDAGFDPAQLGDRQILAALDHVAAICFLGRRLANALGHAHRQGVLHRDVKPANILLSHYGRPLLVDFNMASAATDAVGEQAMFGGTLAYMAPEHLAALDPVDPTQEDAVTAASDQYSLAMLIYELTTGRLPFASAPGDQRPFVEKLRAIAADRRQPERIWTDDVWRSEPGLAAVLARALSVDPADRWPNGEALAAAFDDAVDLRRTLVTVRRENFLPAWCDRHPFVAIGLAGVLPNVLGSAVNIPYNLFRVIPQEHEPTFFRLVNVYNAVVYPVCVLLFIGIVTPIWMGWRGRSSETQERLRSRVLGLPSRAMLISIVGWLPAAFFFPWGLHARAIELPWSLVVHFHVAILIAGLIALTYSVVSVLCVVAFVLYPAFWTDPVGFRRVAAREVRPMLASLSLLPFLSGAIPLVAVVLLITSSPHTFSDGEYEAYRFLTILLIGLGMIGFQLTRAAVVRARSALGAFARAEAELTLDR
ncbi:MAG: protein kinase domain-containing protein [Planctomycetaceae bacterium]